MTALSTRSVSPLEYLAFERQATERHELFDGVIKAMSGASRVHNLIVANAIINLGNQLKGRPCEAYVNDMRVAAPSGANYFYPDLAVACGEPKLEDRHGDTLLNPTLLLEVLSPTTESHDRGRKFHSYRSIGALQQYVLISQERLHVEVFTRTSDTSWSLTEYVGLDAVVPLPSIGCQLSLAEIYDRISFSQADPNIVPPADSV